MDSSLLHDFREFLFALADDELILGHRASEWCGHAPILEEDIAFANIALDEIGHAAAWYSILAEVEGQDPDLYPDQLVYFRSAEDFRNAQIVELPNGDWAFTMLRQYLFDAAEKTRLAALKRSAYQPVAQVAEKMLREELYHERHTRLWVLRLSRGTEESHRRMQFALEACWPYMAQLLAPTPGLSRLVSAGVAPEAQMWLANWQATVLPFLKTECRLILPTEIPPALERSVHTPHLRVILAEMQSLPRQEPEAQW